MKKVRLDPRSGQSTVEFTLLTVFIGGIAFFLIHLSLVLGYSSYIQYVTFMASRAYLAGGTTRDDQMERARETMRAYLMGGAGGEERWKRFGRGEGGDELVPGLQFDSEQTSTYSSLVGVRYTFRSRLFPIPFVSDESVNRVTLTSESWLGREPSDEECLEKIGEAVIDNGC